MASHADQWKNRARPSFEVLEVRDTPAVIGVQADQVVRTLNADVVGVNVCSYDGHLTANPFDPTSATPDPGGVKLLTDAGMHLVRISNGGGADEWHFDQENSEGFTTGAGALANLAAAAGTDAIVTVNYGTGTPQEAAAYLAYLNGSADNQTAIGVDANGRDWGTVAYWAGLRGQDPLANDDGLNHLRASHPDPYGFHYFEVGNEAYFGAWQGYVMPDPGNYAQFAAQFASLAAQIDPSAKIGLDVGNPVEWDSLWNGPVLDAYSQATGGATPGFLSDHFYVYDGGNEAPLTDNQLLTQTVSDPNSVMPIHADSPRNWAGRAADFRQLLTDHYGAAGDSVELIAGEFNSDSGGSTRQTTALTNGLFFADAIGSIMQTEYQGLAVWNFRNSYTPGVAPVDGINGWRDGSDEGIVGTSGNADAPATGDYVPYPTYFAEQLASKLGVTGDSVVPVTSDDPLVSAYAVRNQDGHLSLLLINKSPDSVETANISVSGYTPDTSADLWQYGQAEDNAQRDSADGSASLTHTAPTLGVTQTATGGQFSIDLPAYSMSVLELSPVANAQPVGNDVNVANAAPAQNNANPATGGTAPTAGGATTDLAQNGTTGVTINVNGGLGTLTNAVPANQGTGSNRIFLPPADPGTPAAQVDFNTLRDVAADGMGDVVAVFAGSGTWLYENGNGWEQLSDVDATSVAFDNSGTVIATFAGPGTWTYTDMTGWQQVSTADPNPVVFDLKTNRAL